jgi:hypothetical protein
MVDKRGGLEGVARVEKRSRLASLKRGELSWR